MARIKYLMQSDLVNKFVGVKKEMISARYGMTSEEIEGHKKEILKECTVYDLGDTESEGSLSDVNTYSVVNGKAVIPVKGMLVNEVSICSAFFGETVTTYRFIQEAIAKADKDSQVSEIVLDIDSGGGYAKGVYETGVAIKNAQKPTSAMVGNLTASAAYWLAAATDKIVATQKTGFIGSIGVVIETVDRKGADEKEGYHRIALTNTASFDKWPDATSEDGKAVIVKELDALYGVFADSILEKRSASLTREKIDSFAGKVYIADEAVKLGLVDSFSLRKELLNSISGDKIINRNEGASARVEVEVKEMQMNLKEFLASNTAAQAEYDAVIGAVQAEDLKAYEEKEKQAKADVLRIVKLAGGTLNETALASIENGDSPADFALAEVERMREAGKASVDFGAITPKSELAPRAETVAKKNEKAVDGFYDKKDEKLKKGAK